MSTAPATTPLSDLQYQQETSALLSRVEAATDRWLDADIVDIDAQRSGGLLQLSFPNGSKIIINTQPPLQEVWLAAQAGGYHFRFVGGKWLDTRDRSEFIAALNEHASKQAGKPLEF